MRKRLIGSLVLVAAWAICFGSMPATAVAQAASNPPANNGIWCGLWSGSNFDLSGRCEDTMPKPAPVKPVQPGVPDTSNTGAYVALGDSVAAGAGLPRNPNAITDPRCAQSLEGYPQLVANQLQLPLTNISCSGATAGDLVTSQRLGDTAITAQLDVAFANGTPKLITITAGANDVHWSEFIYACSTTDCTGETYNTAVRAYMATARVKLSYALAEIRNRSNGFPPQVILTGYYNPFSANCANTGQGLTASEIAWLTRQSNALNRIIENTSHRYAFAHFAPVDFTGHDICSGDSWLQGPADPAPFHPTAEGQQAIAAAVVQRAQSLFL